MSSAGVSLSTVVAAGMGQCGTITRHPSPNTWKSPVRLMQSIRSQSWRTGRFPHRCSHQLLSGEVSAQHTVLATSATASRECAAAGALGAMSSEADAEHPKPELENWQNSTSLQPSGFVGGGEFKLIGQGFCRTAAGDSGNFDVVRVRTERECRDACSSSSTCVGYEWAKSTSRCERHKRALTHIKPAKGVFCYARKAKAKCPAKQPAFNSPCKGNLECFYGKERCCGKTFPSLKFQCMSGTWVGLFTEACRSRRC